MYVHKMSTVCSTKTSSVGTSTNCSTSCGSRTGVRIGMSSRMILGTSITCSATGKSASKNWSTSSSCSTISGTGASSVCRPGTVSTICSTVCRWTRTCGLPLSVFLIKQPEERLGRRGASVVVTRRASRALPPWPCSVPLGLRGGCSRPRPWRRSSVHTASTHGSVALFSPPCGTRCVCTSISRPHEVHQQRSRKKNPGQRLSENLRFCLLFL